MAGTCIRAASADSTRASHQSAWRSFFRFLLAFEWAPTPPSQGLFVRYATWLHLREYSYASIRAYVAALPALYINGGVEVSIGKVAMPALGRCLQGIRRRTGEVSQCKENLTIANLRVFREFVDLRRPRQLAHWAAVCVGFFSFLRSGNLVPKLKKAGESGAFLLRGDVHFTERGVILQVRKTKTHQFLDRPLEVPIPYIQGCRFCPVTAIRALFAVTHLESNSPLFAFSSTDWVTYATLRDFIKFLAECAGLDPRAYACHSTRSGGATFASECGASDIHVKAQGTWSSDAYLRYIRISSEERWNLPSRMATCASRTYSA